MFYQMVFVGRSPDAFDQIRIDFLLYPIKGFLKIIINIQIIILIWAGRPVPALGVREVTTETAIISFFTESMTFFTTGIDHVSLARTAVKQRKGPIYFPLFQRRLKTAQALAFLTDRK